MNCKMAAVQRPQAASCRLAAASAAAPACAPAQAGFRPTLTVRQRNCFMGGAAVAARPAAGTARGRRQVAVAASWGRGSSGPEIPDRIVASLPYLVSLGFEEAFATRLAKLEEACGLVSSAITPPSFT